MYTIKRGCSITSPDQNLFNVVKRKCKNGKNIAKFYHKGLYHDAVTKRVSNNGIVESYITKNYDKKGNIVHLSVDDRVNDVNKVFKHDKDSFTEIINDYQKGEETIFSVFKHSFKANTGRKLLTKLGILKQRNGVNMDVAQLKVDGEIKNLFINAHGNQVSSSKRNKLLNKYLKQAMFPYNTDVPIEMTIKDLNIKNKQTNLKLKMNSDNINRKIGLVVEVLNNLFSIKKNGEAIKLDISKVFEAGMFKSLKLDLSSIKDKQIDEVAKNVALYKK